MVLFFPPMRAPVFKSRLTFSRVRSQSPYCWSRFPPEPALLQGQVLSPGTGTGRLTAFLAVPDDASSLRLQADDQFFCDTCCGNHLEVSRSCLPECLANIPAPQDELGLNWDTAAHRPSLPLSSLLSFRKIISSVPGQCSGRLKNASCLWVCASPTPTPSPPTPLKVEKEPL